MLEKFLNKTKITDNKESSALEGEDEDYFYYEEQIKNQKEEIKFLKNVLKEKEKETSKISQLLSSKEKILTIQNKKLSSNEEELTGYINKIFEQQERERIVKWIINCIRETLDIKNVLKTTVEEIGKLLKADRCIIALYDKKTQKFVLKNEYKECNEVESILQITSEIIILPEWENILLKKNEAIIVNDTSCRSDIIRKTQHHDVKSFVIAPVLQKGDILGIIAVHQTNNPRNWKDHHVEILRYIGSQIAIAIRQAGLYSDLQKKKDKEILLRNIVSTIRSSLGVNEVKKQIVKEIGKAFDADRCFIRTYDSTSDRFVLDDVENDFYCKNNETIKDLFYKNGDNYFREKYKEGSVVSFDNLEKFSIKNKKVRPELIEFFKKAKVKTHYSIPIISADTIFGVLVIQYTRSNPCVDDETLELLKMIVTQIGLGMRQIQLYENSNKMAKREAMVRKIITKIRGTLDINEVLSSVCEEIGNSLNVERVVIVKFDNNKEDSKWHLAKEYKLNDELEDFNDENINEKIGDFWEKILFKQSEKVNLFNTNQSELPEHVKEYYKKIGTKSFVGIPIKKGDDKWGGLFLSCQSEERPWSDDEIHLLETITNQLYIAIRQANLYYESEKTNRLKSEFLAGMSHEFRTPLNAIIGFSEMLSSGTCGNLTAKQFEYLGNISISGAHLLRLVNDILDLSKIESGNMEVDYEKFETKQVINETISILYNLAQNKNITIKMEVEEVFIKSDSKRFRQILYNLLSNAIKFTEEKGSIIVKSEIIDKTFKVEVKDTGIGISEGDRSKIFNQFAQIDSSYTRKQEGTGLGLTITKKLVELLGGTIDFESHEGQGSKFWFILNCIAEN
jgi:signal transduction histidine kinase